MVNWEDVVGWAEMKREVVGFELPLEELEFTYIYT